MTCRSAGVRDERRRRREVMDVFKRLRLPTPDFATVLVVVVALAIFVLMTFELWVSHGPGH